MEVSFNIKYTVVSALTQTLHCDDQILMFYLPPAHALPQTV